MKTRERCWVTKEWLDEMKEERRCYNCHTRSCPVNTGFAKGAEEVPVEEENSTHE